jgi:hypothetical protein
MSCYFMQNNELFSSAMDEIMLRYSDDPELKITVDSIGTDNTSVAKIKLQSHINNLEDKVI